jgi:hypothetical protein
MSRITQRGATGPLAIHSNGTFQTSTDTNLDTLLGSRWDLSDGREVVLASVATGTTVAPGKLYHDAAIIADHQNLATTAVTAYSNNGNVPASVTATLGATAVTANQYQGGFLIVNDATGEGQTLRIASHPAAALSATCKFTLEDAPNTALVAATSEVSLIPPHGKDVIITPATTATNGSYVGIALCPVAADAYGFFVTKGIVSALSDNTEPVIGTAIGASLVTAGAIGDVAYAANVLTSSIVGNALQTAVSTEYRAVVMNL